VGRGESPGDTESDGESWTLITVSSFVRHYKYLLHKHLRILLESLYSYYYLGENEVNDSKYG